MVTPTPTLKDSYLWEIPGDAIEVFLHFSNSTFHLAVDESVLLIEFKFFFIFEVALPVHRGNTSNVLARGDHLKKRQY